MIEPNTNEKAVVRVTIPTKKVLASELAKADEKEKTIEDDKRKSPEPDRKTPESGKRGDDSDKESEKKEEEVKEDVLVDVEDDQNDMAL